MSLSLHQVTPSLSSERRIVASAFKQGSDALRVANGAMDIARNHCKQGVGRARAARQAANPDTSGNLGAFTARPTVFPAGYVQPTSPRSSTVARGFSRFMSGRGFINSTPRPFFN